MLNAFRRVLFWSHLICGVTAGIVILIMCVTGVALTYQKEMQWWADTRHYRALPPAGVPRAGVDQILDAVRAFDATASPTTVAWRAQADAPVAVVAGTRTLYVNPYTAHVYGEGTGQDMRQFFTTMTNWHRYLAMAGDARPTGKAITGASNLTFLFIVLSGMYLWWPKSFKWTQIRNVTWFRGGLPGKARAMAYRNHWAMVTLRVPTSADEPLVFTIDGGDAGQPNLRGTLTMTQGPLAGEKWEDISAQTRARRARTFLRFAHTGEVWGLFGQTVAGLVSAGGAVLVYTGLSLALRRFFAWVRRATRVAASPATSTSFDAPNRPM